MFGIKTIELLISSSKYFPSNQNFLMDAHDRQMLIGGLPEVILLNIRWN